MATGEEIRDSVAGLRKRGNEGFGGYRAHQIFPELADYFDATTG